MKERVVIAIAGRKGGGGKTTSAAYLAAALHEAGRTVTGIDTDPDVSWLKLHDAGLLPYEVLRGNRDDLHSQIEQAPGDVVIDTPPNDEAIVLLASAVADEVIAPLTLTGMDAARLMQTLTSVAQVERMRNRPLASVLVTKYRPRLIVARELLAELEERNVPILEAKIPLLTAYEAYGTPIYLDDYRTVLEELEVLE